MIDQHRGAIEYDFRTRFPGLRRGVDSIGRRDMSWGEATRLLSILRADPSSAFAAALEGWDHPISREALILMDQFDLDVQINSDPKKGKPPRYRRPFPVEDKQRQRFGNTGGRTRAEVVEILNALGHDLPA